MAKGKWKYRNEGDDQFGICYDCGEDRRFLWMGTTGTFQLSMARLICRELNRAGVEMGMGANFLPEVVSRAEKAKAKP
jgi:hypothetical protein